MYATHWTGRPVGICAACSLQPHLPSTHTARLVALRNVKHGVEVHRSIRSGQCRRSYAARDSGLSFDAVPDGGVGSTANRWTPPRTVEMCLRIRACVRAFRLHGPRLLPLSACPKASRILASCSDPFCAGRRDYSKHPKSLCRNLASCFLPNFFLNYYSCLLRAKNGF